MPIDNDGTEGSRAQDIDAVLQQPQRKLVIADREIDLVEDIRNEIYILFVEESRGSAGGRAAGSGSRRIVRVCGFTCDRGFSKRFFETSKEDEIGLFEVPYSAVAMDIILSSGKPLVVQGIVDPELVKAYGDVITNLA